MFLNPTMLAGLGGAAVPLVLHLLARARYRNVDGGAMMFLEARDPRAGAIARLKEWILLLTRMALVGLIAVALARPVISRKWAGQEGRVTAVIVLDRSYSMGFEEAGRSRFARAREAVLQILAALRKGDEVALIDLGDGVSVREPTANLQTVARDVAEMDVSGGSAEMSRALAVIRPSNPPLKGGEMGHKLNKEQPLVVTVGPHSSTIVRVPVIFRETGSHVLNAEIKAPGLEADNRCQTAIDVTDPIETLIVSGDEQSDEVRRESFVLRVALAPYWSRRGGDPRKWGDRAVVH